MKSLIKLKPISKQEFEMAEMRQTIATAIAGIPTPTNGSRGAQGASGRDGKDGVTTTVVKEVLANKEKLLSKEEFEEFKAMMQKMESDIRQSLGKTHNYFPGGGAPLGALANVIEVSVDTTITDRQLLKEKINIILVLQPGITVTLPASDATKIVWVQQGYEGSGEFTVCREST